MTARSLEIDERLCDLAGIEITDDNRTATRSEIDSLTAERGDIATQLRALAATEDHIPTEVENPDPQVIRSEQNPPRQLTGEHGRLIERAEISRYLLAAVRGDPLTGAEAELLDAENITVRGEGGVVIPDRLMVPDPIIRRAVQTTDQDGPLMQMPWGGVIYRSPTLDALNPDYHAAEFGRKESVIMTVGATADVEVEGAAVQYDDPTFQTLTMEPTRVAAGFDVSEEFLLTTGPMGESTLRTNLDAAIANEIERHLLSGPAGAPLQAVWGSSGLAPTAPGTAGSLPAVQPTVTASVPAALTFSTASALAHARVDGHYANRADEVSLIMGADTYRRLFELYPSNSGGTTLYDSMAAGDVLERRAGNLIVCGHFPGATTVATNTNVAALVAVLGRHPMQAAMVTWGGGTQIIRDHLSRANVGEVRLTARRFLDFKILRQAAYAVVPVKLR